MVHIYNEILLSHKKGWIWVSWTEVDEPTACYMKWSKSERENKYHILTYIHGIQKDGTHEPVCRSGIEMQT